MAREDEFISRRKFAMVVAASAALILDGCSDSSQPDVGDDVPPGSSNVDGGGGPDGETPPGKTPDGGGMADSGVQDAGGDAGDASDADASGAPVWTTVPPITFVVGVASSISIAPFVTDPDGDPLTITKNNVDLPAGVTFDAVGKRFVYDGLGPVGSTAGHVLTADDGHS